MRGAFPLARSDPLPAAPAPSTRSPPTGNGAAGFAVPCSHAHVRRYRSQTGIDREGERRRHARMNESQDRALAEHFFKFIESVRERAEWPTERWHVRAPGQSISDPEACSESPYGILQSHVIIIASDDEEEWRVRFAILARFAHDTMTVQLEPPHPKHEWTVSLAAPDPETVRSVADMMRAYAQSDVAKWTWNQINPAHRTS
jgi:hypothetical protein